jgi:hypothetical protein
MLWVAFRTVVQGRTGILRRFLKILRGPNRDLFTWDDIDAAVLYQALVKDSELGLLPRAWHRYMVEIDLRTWLQIRDMTWTVCRPRSQSENLLIRLAAASLLLSSTLNVPEIILAPFDLSLDNFRFGSITHAIHKDYTTKSSVTDFNSTEFWAAPNLRNWLSIRIQDQCLNIWNTHFPMSVLQRLQSMHLFLDAAVLPKVNYSSKHFSRKLTLESARIWRLMHITC